MKQVIALLAAASVVYAVASPAAQAEEKDLREWLTRLTAQVGKLDKRVGVLEGASGKSSGSAGLAARVRALEGAVGAPDVSPTQPHASSSKTSGVQPNISVRVSNKRYQDGRAQDYVWWDITYTATGIKKPTRAIKGVLKFNDLFGEAQFMIQVTINDPIRPGGTIKKTGVGFDYNQYIDSHQWLRRTPLKDMKVVLVVEQILFADGSRWSAEK